MSFKKENKYKHIINLTVIEYNYNISDINPKRKFG